MNGTWPITFISFCKRNIGADLSWGEMPWQDPWELARYLRMAWILKLAQFLGLARIFRQVYNISNFSQGLARKWASVEIRWKVRNLTNSMFPQTAKQSKLLQLDFCVFLTLRKIIVWANTIKWWGCEDESGDCDGNGDANENGCVNKIVGILCESESVSHLVVYLTI